MLVRQTNNFALIETAIEKFNANVMAVNGLFDTPLRKLVFCRLDLIPAVVDLACRVGEEKVVMLVVLFEASEFIYANSSLETANVWMQPTATGTHRSTLHVFSTAWTPLWFVMVLGASVWHFRVTLSCWLIMEQKFSSTNITSLHWTFALPCGFSDSQVGDQCEWKMMVVKSESVNRSLA